MSKPILCLDFDGVIHSYTSGWQGVDVIVDPITPGFFEWLKEAVKHFDVQVYSSRSKEPRGIDAMRRFIHIEAAKHFSGSLPAFVTDLKFCHEKPAAFLTIDDHAMQFSGDWGSYHPEGLLSFLPWNKR